LSSRYDESELVQALFACALALSRAEQNAKTGGQMNLLTSKSTVLLAGAAIFCIGFSTVARAENLVTFTGGYTTTFSNRDGDFGAGIYSANIDGMPSSSGIICDDYRDEIATNETWNANAYQVSSLTAANLGETLFGNTIGFSGYAEVATLASMMFNNDSTFGFLSGITQSELASAIWDITTPGGIHGLDPRAKILVAFVKASFSGRSTAAQSYLSSLTNLWILTPNPHPGFGLEPQEMFIRGLNVPEGGAPLLYLLLAALACLGAMFVGRPRARIAQS